jgi:gamma-glutamyl hercynylcysteine S-oxide synthase
MLTTESVVVFDKTIKDKTIKNDIPKTGAKSLSLMDRLSEARRRSDALFNIVRAGFLYERPIPERHRIIFYVGHLEAFDWNLLSDSVLGLQSLNPKLDRLFAFGIDPIGGGLPSDVPSDWPTRDAVRDYVTNIRRGLDNHLEKAIAAGEATKRDCFSLVTLLNVAIEHRLMHVETLAYMLHQLPLNMKEPPEAGIAPIVYSSPVNSSPVQNNLGRKMITVPAGTVTLGLSRGAQDFGWDNEFDAHSVEVPGFAIDQYKITNRQYLEFMSGGGYETRALWTEDDWNWKTEQSISHPSFWRKDGAVWRYRSMFAELPLPLDWPVYVSQAEASAYARWAGKSLPTEAEWLRAGYGTADGTTSAYPWGNESPTPESGNFDFKSWDPTSFNAFPSNQSTFGVHDMLGNGWEWTSTVFGPFPGFKPFAFYKGYSADFFDGKHFVMKGGSARTAECMLRSTFRNWFQAHYQYVYAGFRCVSR